MDNQTGNRKVYVAADVPHTPRPETGWLIELVDDKHGLPEYWNGRVTAGNAFTSNHLAAVRFARKFDATTVIEHIEYLSAYAMKAVEHQWGL